jgi:hypothetical protein
MDLSEVSDQAFKSSMLAAIAAELAHRDAPFTVTEMLGWVGGSQSSVDRAVKRLVKAQLLVRTGTLYSKAPTAPAEFWTGFLALKAAINPAANRPARRPPAGTVHPPRGRSSAG